MLVNESGSYANITSSTQVTSYPADIIGIFVASASSTPTIKVLDSASGVSSTIVNTFSPVGGIFYSIPAKASRGVYVEIGGTVDCTVFTVNA